MTSQRLPQRLSQTIIISWRNLGHSQYEILLGAIDQVLTQLENIHYSERVYNSFTMIK